MDRSNPGVPMVIARDEFAARQRRAAAVAAARGLDGLLVVSRGSGSYDRCGDLVYLANYYPVFPLLHHRPPDSSGRGHGFLILPVDGAPILCVDTPNHRPDIAAVEDVRVDAHLLALVAAALQEKGLADARLGLAGADILSLAAYRWLQSELPQLELVESDDILEGFRRIKSPAEQAQIRRACSAGIAILDAMLSAIEPGASEADAVAAALGELARRGAALVDLQVTSGRFSRTHAHTRMPSWDPGRILARGELLHVDLFGSLEGYFFDIGRTTVVGAVPDAAQRRLIGAARDAVDAAIAAIKPGVLASAVAAAGWGALRDSGVLQELSQATNYNAFGHGIGVGWEDPTLGSDDDTPIEAGMCLAVEKTLGMPGVGGALWEENLLVHRDGVEVLTRAGRSWFMVDR